MMILLTKKPDSPLKGLFQHHVYGPYYVESDGQKFNPVLASRLAEAIEGASDIPVVLAQGTPEELKYYFLAFPDVVWILLCSEDNTELSNCLDLSKFECPINLLHVIKQKTLPYDPLFDPLGLRNKIRENLKQGNKGNKGNKYAALPERKKVAVSIDEEVPYALFTGYAAYRLGYRTWAIYTDAMARQVLGTNGILTNSDDLDMTFEDLYLNFPDRAPDAHYSVLKESKDEKKSRDEIFPALKKARKRYFITVGHSKTQKGILKKNREYLAGLKLNPLENLEKYRFIYKTVGGLFSLYQKTGEWKKERAQLADGYKWPPDKDVTIPDETQPSGHSTPGMLYAIAQFMIDRAKRILGNATTVRHAMTAAVLAMDAKELLMARTPVTSLEALSIQHEAEVMAESMFLGIEYNLPLKERFQEIEREVNTFSAWFKKKERKRTAMNARLSIAERLAKRFVDMNQFEEEQDALDEARKLRFKLWAMDKNRPYRILFYPVLKYVELSLRSFGTFILFVFLWTLFFGGAYYGVGKLENRKSCSENEALNLLEAFSASTAYFFTLQSPQHWVEILPKTNPYCTKAENQKEEKISNKDHRILMNSLWYLLLTFQGMISLLNMGLLISHVYLKLSRR